MPPIPKEVYQKNTSKNRNANTSTTYNDDSIVISGMSGLFPQAGSVKEFSENLFNKVNVMYSYILFTNFFALPN